MINRRLTFAFTALAVAACTEADGPLTTGIYQLEVSALSESCDAPAPSGVFEVARFTSACEAAATAAVYEHRAHKQMYWVEVEA